MWLILIRSSDLASSIMRCDRVFCYFPVVTSIVWYCFLCAVVRLDLKKCSHTSVQFKVMVSVFSQNSTHSLQSLLLGSHFSVQIKMVLFFSMTSNPSLHLLLLGSHTSIFYLIKHDLQDCRQFSFCHIIFQHQFRQQCQLPSPVYPSPSPST